MNDIDRAAAQRAWDAIKARGGRGPNENPLGKLVYPSPELGGLGK